MAQAGEGSRIAAESLGRRFAVRIMPAGKSNAPVTEPWSRDAGDVLKTLAVSAEAGLDDAEVRRRRKEYGPNRLREAKKKSLRVILANQFKSLIILLLTAAAVLSFSFTRWLDGTAIVVVIAINTAIGFVTEWKAVRSMEALRKLSRVQARVRRVGEAQEIPAERLVPGDIVLVEGGDIVSADLRLVEASKLQADESALTGESVPVRKTVDPVEGDVEIPGRKNMLFKGTNITRGSGLAVVVSTGMSTELGRISSLMEETEEEETPLEKRLDRLGRKLIWVTLGIAAAITVSGTIVGRDFVTMIEVAIALAVAAIPEGLPIVATIALARGMWRMARRNALVNRLSAVETLGATTVICSDKTGTLTENRMTVKEIALPEGTLTLEADEFQGPENAPKEENGDRLERLLRAGVLCNNASLRRGGEGEEGKRAVGDPMEVALLEAGRRVGLERGALLEEVPELREEAFDPDVKMMATFHRARRGVLVAVKGAPEAVLEACTSVAGAEGSLSDEDRQGWLEKSREMASRGLRLLALADKEAKDEGVEPYADLCLLGLAGLLDPPRGDVREAISRCRGAGIRVVMVTGDHPETARIIAATVGIVKDGNGEDVILGRDLRGTGDLSDRDLRRLREASVFARVSPEQKLILIDLHQQAGEIVGMTGDGVNDAPALRKADIGIAMGRRGTQVAREAADMVLQDDAFTTIVTAIEQGRVIFNNIRKFVLYLLSCNVSEVLIVSLASLTPWPLPLMPLQILFLNLVTDVFPALALGAGEGEAGVMDLPPKEPAEPILAARHWGAIAVYGSLITGSVLGAFAVALHWMGMTDRQAVTVSFLTLAFAQLWHVLNMRSAGTSLLRNEITKNPYVWGAVLLCAVLILAAVYVPGLSEVLRVAPPSGNGWLLVAGMSLVTPVAGQVFRVIQDAGSGG
jgi:Ca2+-transporting ATPase